jgi:hypothetical protein
MLTPAREEELMAKALHAFEGAGIATMSRADASAYLTGVMTLAYELLRDVETEKYIRGWLDSAIADLAKRPTFHIRRPS